MNELPALPARSDEGRRRFRSHDDLLLTTAVGVSLAASIRFLVTAVAGSWPDTPLLSDFVSFWTGASLLQGGARPEMFDMERQKTVQATLLATTAPEGVVRIAIGHMPYFNPPPLALAFVPLTWLPFHWAYFVWAGISTTMFALSVALPLRGSSGGRRKAVAMLAFGGVALTLREGQVNALFLLAFSFALASFRRGRPILAGALLGVLWLKPQYAVPFALLLLVKRRWRESSGMMGVAAGIGALSLAMVGPAGIADCLAELQRIGAFRPPPDTMARPEYMVNWRAMLLNVWPAIPDGLGTTLVLLLGGATVFVALLGWREGWDPNSATFRREMLILTLATILVSPHSHLHGAVLLLAPVAALAAAAPAEPEPVRGWRTLLMAGLLISVAVVTFGPQRWLMAPYLLVCLGALVVGRSAPRTERPARARVSAPRQYQ